MVSGDHSLTDDVDVHAITVPPGARILAQLFDANAALSCDRFDIAPRLRLLDPGGAVLGTSTGPCARIDGTGVLPPSPAARNPSGVTQTYYVEVSTEVRSPGDPHGHFAYRLQVTTR